jgi:HSP20 family molecular chaperone IbpA
MREMEEINSGLPKIRVKENDDEVIVKIYISGINAEDIELEVKKDFLKIDINNSLEEEKKGKNWFMQEWESSSFRGKISLPCKVIPMLIHHEYNGRFLEVKLKKDKE